MKKLEKKVWEREEEHSGAVHSKKRTTRTGKVRGTGRGREAIEKTAIIRKTSDGTRAEVARLEYKNAALLWDLR